jgi:hypothetical protein
MNRSQKYLPVLLLACFFQSAYAAPADVPSALHWYRGNTHTHTINSDGNTSPEAVALWYRQHGYQFLFLTDHDYLTDPALVNALVGATERFLLLPGEEVTQWSDDPTRAAARMAKAVGAPAYVNALFIDKLIQPFGASGCQEIACGANGPANMPIGQTIVRNIETIRDAGGIAQINHPNFLWSLRPTDFADVPDGVLFEIWNGGGLIINNLGGDDGRGDVHPSAEADWDWMLSRGKVVWGVGSDDAHHEHTADFENHVSDLPGHAWIVVHASSLTSDNLKLGISTGNFYASNGVVLDDILGDSSQLSIKIHAEDMGLPDLPLPRYTTRFIGRTGAVLATVAGLNPVYRFKGSETYVRAVIADSDGRQAWTQPVFLDGRKTKSPYSGR